ncbi:hypothetical protein [Bacillus multifaciens]|uniref:hypothetical protein n=1 Tax=Bacillus multifaciens TaxID=3068506 RepID=UPI0027423BE8|nr:hypothetical protein [Bacillus sp. WLY-B-L8]MDP7981229.1 hypothetical protein [Bacillus sp. WLY-B-L8]
MHRSYYVHSSGPNLNLPYGYEIPYQHYKTNPLYIASTYDINRIPTGSVSSSYTYGGDRDKGTSGHHQGLSDVHVSVPNSVTHRQDKTERSNNNATYI